ncbi:PIG-L family deacetylase [Frankia sp. CNm7]|uniref:PIG-L family deacetylase n=1 Tax=Frankia nepalensis TaxID=1836974 RepID=A0A937RAQ5_9ACTN|nr:PIG-L family deacetylase [Frankia nepalensis]MBL7498562.1 PIG-L family deacetylase [Frankia nepalensis]MBL7513763.1 PIG-L family deacetylase [Frankia nepalensis]MBL7524241.1 PIG-L family deacetylase [Frankia nepalensis]MBL7626277.1 PIG-L family deacetylase [Frankia nepalensis]
MDGSSDGGAAQPRSVAAARAAAVARQVRPAALRERALLPARSAYRRAWMRRGRDITRAMTRASCLVVAPHPDDETLGCGVSIMRKREAGTQVTVVIVTDGAAAEPAILPPAELAALRKEEARRAGSRLGLRASDIRFLDVPDATVSERLDEVADRLAELIKELEPEQLLIPTSCEGHPDHDATNAAAIEAAKRAGFTGQVLEYAVWLWTHWPWTRGYGSEGYNSRRLLRDPLTRVREVRPLLVGAKGYRSRQAYALAAHGSQVGPAVGGGALPLSLLAATRTPFELYLEAGALAHLDFTPAH